MIVLARSRLPAPPSQEVLAPASRFATGGGRHAGKKQRVLTKLGAFFDLRSDGFE
jgi:hypothetical protein